MIHQWRLKWCGGYGIEIIKSNKFEGLSSVVFHQSTAIIGFRTWVISFEPVAVFQNRQYEL